MKTKQINYFILSALLLLMARCTQEPITLDVGNILGELDLEIIGGVLRSQNSISNRIAINFEEEDESISDVIYYMLTQQSSNAITLTAVVDEDLVEIYNAINQTQLEPLPTANVQFEGGGSLSVDANKQQSSKIKMTISAQDLQPGVVYLLPITIAQTPTGVEVRDEKQVLYYGIQIRKTDVSNMPLNSSFFTVLYLNTEDYQPLLADIFALQKQDGYTFEIIWEETVGNIVNLKSSTIDYDINSKRTLFRLGNDLKYVLENSNKYIRPLQDHDRKVCITIENGGKGVAFCNMNDVQISDFVSQVKDVIEMYDLDGVNLWDEESKYGKDGMPPVNTTSYPKLIKAFREALPKKLLTVTDKGEPTEYFYDVDKCGGIEVGKHIDYAWSGYNSAEETLQIVDPWDSNNTYTDYARKPFAGITQEQYGCINHPLYPVVVPDEILFSTENPLMWRFDGMKRNNILVTHDLITHLQGPYEGQALNFLNCLWYLSDDGIDENFNFPYMYTGMERYVGALAQGSYGKWIKDW